VIFGTTIKLNDLS